MPFFKKYVAFWNNWYHILRLSRPLLCFQPLNMPVFLLPFRKKWCLLFRRFRFMMPLYSPDLYPMSHWYLIFRLFDPFFPNFKSSLMNLSPVFLVNIFKLIPLISPDCPIFPCFSASRPLLIPFRSPAVRQKNFKKIYFARNTSILKVFLDMIPDCSPFFLQAKSL